MNKTLYDKKAVSSQEYQKALNEFNFQKERKRLTQQILKQDSISTKQSLDQSEQTYNRTRSALELMRRKVGDLIVRAPVDGQLTSFDAEIGQSKSSGERLGQKIGRASCRERVCQYV